MTKRSSRRGFWTTTPEGHTIHVDGRGDMDEETLSAIRELADTAYNQVLRQRAEAAESRDIAPHEQPGVRQC